MKSKKKEKRPGGRSNPVFKPVFYVKIYQMAQKRWSLSKMAKKLGVTRQAMNAWKNNDPAVRHALREGELSVTHQGRSKTTFLDYVYERLPLDLQKMWDRLCRISNDIDAQTKIETIFANDSNKAKRMHLWVYAYVHHNFSKRAACRALNIRDETLRGWMRQKKFKEFVGLLEEYRKEMAEESLMDLVAMRDPAAVLFVNKSLNKEKYGTPEKMKVEVEHKGEIAHKHDGTIKHQHEMIPVSNLDLPLETMLEVWEGVQKYKKASSEQNSAGPGQLTYLNDSDSITDADFEVMPAMEDAAAKVKV